MHAVPAGLLLQQLQPAGDAWGVHRGCPGWAGCEVGEAPGPQGAQGAGPGQADWHPSRRGRGSGD